MTLLLDTDTRYKASAFIETYTGRAFTPTTPNKAHLSIIDIAHALSNQCRFSGHVNYFYSVAQHCVLLSDWLSEKGGSAEDCLQILMHDAAEAYLIDMPRPIKQHMPVYRIWDNELNKVIREWMGWADLPILAVQDEIDSRILVDEREALMSRSGLDWGHDLEPLGVLIEPWSPEEAEQVFLTTYASLCHAAYGKHFYLNEEWGVPCQIHYEMSSDQKAPFDLMEVDVRGGVGRIKVRGQDGILKRDETAGKYPRPQWEWWHGKFELTEPEPVT